MAGQSIGDRFVAAQQRLVGSEMSQIVCKASTSELMGPKKKHLSYLQGLTNHPNVSIPDLVDCLIERSKQPKWIIVFKSLITTHHLMCYGNEKFVQHLASRNSLYSLSNFLDKSGVQGYDMSLYIRKYSQYLNEKAITYRAVAYDFTRIKRGKDGMLRSLDSDKLIKALPILQKQLDSLLEFDARPNDLINGVINAAFFLLFKDLIRLFACYNDGVINLLEKYFTMKKSQCKEALDIYKRFLTRMNKVSDMLKVAEQVGIDKGDIPDLTNAPSSLLDALEQHLAHLEGKKTDGSASKNANISALTNISTSLTKIDANAQKFALDEEKLKLETFKKQHEEQLQKSNKPEETPTLAQVGASNSQANPTSSSSDLLEIFGSTTVATTSNAFEGGDFGSFPQSNFSVQSTAGIGNNWGSTAQPNNASTFGFGQTSVSTTEPNLFNNSPFANSQPESTTLSNQGLLQPTIVGQSIQPQPQLIQQPQTGRNLESSLASAVENLTVNQKANQNFEPKTEKKLTGGVNYNPLITPSPVTYSTVSMNAMNPANPMMTNVPPQNMAMYGNNIMWNNMGMPMQQQQPAFAMQYHQQQQMHMLNPNNPFGSM